MTELVALVAGLSPLPILQAFFGAAAFMVCVYMMLRANKDKQVLPAPAPGGLTEPPQIHMQGPASLLDMMREIRDSARQSTEYLYRIAECSRITRENTVEQTKILAQMAEDQRIERAVVADRAHR